MEVHTIDDIPIIKNPVATIGIFDGVHRGHKYILNSLMEKARQTGGSSVVISLWPHPRIVLNKDVWNFRLLHSQEEKIHHLDKLGLDHYIMIPFSKEFASTSACDFVKDYLVNRLHISCLILGYDNTFGRDREGSPDSLSTCAERSGLIVEKLDEFKNES